MADCCQDLRRELNEIKRLLQQQQQGKIEVKGEYSEQRIQQGVSTFLNSASGQGLLGTAFLGMMSTGMGPKITDAVLGGLGGKPGTSDAVLGGIQRQLKNMGETLNKTGTTATNAQRMATEASKEAAKAGREAVKAGKDAATALSQIVAIATALAAAGIAVAGIKVGEIRGDSLESRIDNTEAGISKVLGLLNPIKRQIDKLEKNVNEFKKLTNDDLDSLNQDVIILEEKRKNLNDDVAALKSFRDNMAQPKLKSLNDDVAALKSFRDNTAQPKLKSLNDDVAALKSFRDNTAQPKLKSLNDIVAELNSNYRKLVFPKLVSLEKLIQSNASTAQAGIQKALTDAATALRQKAIPGPKGERGLKGDKGERGPAGEKGPKGERGSTGATGAAGAKGATGAMGAPGPQGLRGAPGINGQPGRDGVDGKPGAPGKDGLPGKDGKDGRPGRDGKDVDEKIVADIQAKLNDIQSKVTPLPAVAAAVNKLPDTINNVPNSEAFKASVANGTCRTLQTGGCMRREFDSLGNNLNKQNGLLEKFNTAMQGADLALLGVINTKLGPQLSGGIGGQLIRMTDFLADKFDKLWKTFRLDRIISMLTLAASIHNAAMLSRDLAETLVETLDTILRAIQGWMPDFLKSPDGDDFDLEEMLKAKLEKFLQDLLGKENYIELKATWIRANRILSTAANMLSSIRSMFSAVIDALQTIGRWIALGFNGIQREGLVSDRTWPWMDETPNFKPNAISRFTDKLEDLENATSSIQQLASSSIEFTSEAKELAEESQKLIKLLDEKSQKTTEKEVAEALKNQAPLVEDNDVLPAE